MEAKAQAERPAREEEPARRPRWRAWAAEAETDDSWGELSESTDSVEAAYGGGDELLTRL